MNGTPRVHGAFPLTPQTEGVRRRRFDDGQRPTPPTFGGSGKLPSIASLKPQPAANNDAATPLISTDLISPAHQRFLVFCIYISLWLWQLWDFYKLVQDDTESLWQFLKWLSIHSVFFYGVPAFRIPWLEWSSGTTTLLFAAHAFINAMLMFRIASPFTIFFEPLVRFFWDKEQGLSDRKVEPSKLLDTAPFIQGRQVIRWLPEGSAILNPNRDAFCLGEGRKLVHLPIQINQTEPSLIELLRIDLDTNQNETVSIKASEVKRLRKTAINSQKHHDDSQPLVLHYPYKKTGRFTILKVIDQSGLAVRPRPSEILVVSCPRANVLKAVPNRCRGDLSDVEIQVDGTPPLKMKYRKVVNNQVIKHDLQSIQPEGFVTPLARSDEAGQAVVKHGTVDVSWARSQSTSVSLTDVMLQVGSWSFAVDEIEDALGNAVSYDVQVDSEGNPKPKSAHVQQTITVHDRPKLSLWSRKERRDGADLQHPVKLAKDGETKLPLRFRRSTSDKPLDEPHSVTYAFTPADEIANAAYEPQIRELTFNNPGTPHLFNAAGMYTLRSVKTEYCEGDVVEPASLLLEHAEEPAIEYSEQVITDKCKAMPVGLLVDLDFTGTPPFTVTYLVTKDHSRHARQQTIKTENRRYQLELKPDSAGHYKYNFISLSDGHYHNLPLEREISHDVKPSASARFVNPGHALRLCKDEAADVQVQLIGEPPFALSYALVQGSKVVRKTEDNIEGDIFNIKTDSLSGGDYSISLLSIKDERDCPASLKDELKFSVRHQRPKASFGPVDGKRIKTLVQGAGLAIPLRLTGEGPWSLQIRHMENPNSVTNHKAHDANSKFDVHQAGTYEIMSVKDQSCPGEVDETANSFTVEWIARPQMSLQDIPGLTKIGSGKDYEKSAICEGEEDFLELNFSGSPPFGIKYEEHGRPEQGPKSLRSKEIPGVLNGATIQLNTDKAGEYEYKFTALRDENYKHDPKHFTPINVRQRINSRPSAKFKNPGRTYSYCTIDGSGGEDIPVTLIGVAPFHLELEIKHSGTAKPEILRFPNLQSNNEVINIPRQHLTEGHASLSIRKVKDSRGCQSKSVPMAAVAPRVQISVFEPPKIEPVEAVREDYCVGERLSFRLTGAPPFNIYYKWHNKDRKASSGSTFQRIADEPGTFVVTGLSDSGSECRAQISGITKTIHPIPEAKIARGKQEFSDIHEGGTVDMVFELKGEPPFIFTYTRAELPARKGQQQGAVVETKTIETWEHTYVIEASEEGVYEILSVKDKWCGASRQGIQSGRKGQKLLVQG